MEIEKAFKKLIITNPFYGLFCLNLPKAVTTSIPTLGVRKKGLNAELCINPEFWEKFDDKQQLALLQHELSHIALQHMFLKDYFSDPKLFNISADMEVNSYIENLPDSAIKASDFKLENGLGVKTYYEKLSQPDNDQQQDDQNQDNKEEKEQQDNQENNQEDNQSGDSVGNNDSTEQQEQSQSTEEKEQSPSENKDLSSQYPDKTRNNKKPYGSHENWKEFTQSSEAAQQLIKNNINNILKTTAEQVEKSCGNIPGEFKELIEKLKEKKPEIFNWKAYFRRLLGSIYDVNIKSSRRKMSKRFEGSAGTQHKKKVSILVAVDTSGSVSSKELQDFFAEIEYIYKAGARVTILECDTQINKVIEYDGKTVPEIVGRGGTDFNAPVEYYIQYKRDYSALIYFTDGECSLPDKNPSGMVWVITSNGCHQDYPGKTIYIPEEQYQN